MKRLGSFGFSRMPPRGHMSQKKGSDDGGQSLTGLWTCHKVFVPHACRLRRVRDLHPSLCMCVHVHIFLWAATFARHP